MEHSCNITMLENNEKEWNDKIAKKKNFNHIKN